jgi:hypothetical protein
VGWQNSLSVGRPPRRRSAAKGPNQMDLHDEVFVRQEEITCFMEYRLAWRIVFEPFRLRKWW